MSATRVTTARTSRRWPGAVALAVAVLALPGCSGDDSGDVEAGALAAAETYVDAIADLDFEAAEAMTDPDAFKYQIADDDLVDVRAALPDATEPIRDAWVQVISTGERARYGEVEYVVGVSYTIDGLTGGDTITVRLDDDGDAADVEDWTVTEGLIADEGVHAERTVKAGSIGDVELHLGQGYQRVWGYPAGYQVEAKDKRGVDPLRINLGVADLPPWDTSLPRLGATDR